MKAIFAEKYRGPGVLKISRIIESDKFKALIGRTFPLKQMAEAHRYVETGHKRGNAAVAVDHA